MHFSLHVRCFPCYLGRALAWQEESPLALRTSLESKHRRGGLPDDRKAKGSAYVLGPCEEFRGLKKIGGIWVRRQSSLGT